MPAFRADGDAVLISVRLSPRASRDGIRDITEETVKIAVTSPPVDNEANEHLIRFLAKKISIARSNIEIVQGQLRKTKSSD